MAWWDRVDWSDPISRDCSLNRGLVGWWMGAPNCYGGLRMWDLLNRNHGTLTNMDPATDWVSTQYGAALDLDGSNDYIQTGYKLFEANTDTFTIIVDVLRTSTAFPIVIRDESGAAKRFRFDVIAGPRLNWQEYDSGGAGYIANTLTTFGLPTNERHVVAVERDGVGRTIEFYLDGQLATKNLTISMPATTGQGSPGGCVFGQFRGTTFGAGQIASVLIFNRILSPLEHKYWSEAPRQQYPDTLRRPRGRSMVSVPDEIINIFQKNNNKILTGSSLNFRGIKTGGNL